MKGPFFDEKPMPALRKSNVVHEDFSFPVSAHSIAARTMFQQGRTQ
jgi:hypothetical protein